MRGGALALLILAGMLEVGPPASAGQPPTPLLPIGARPRRAQGSPDALRERSPLPASARALCLPSWERSTPPWTLVPAPQPGLTAAERAKLESSRALRRSLPEDPLLTRARLERASRPERDAAGAWREGRKP